MSLTLPLQGHPLRDIIDTQWLADNGPRFERVTPWASFQASCQAQLANQPGVVSITGYAIDPDGLLILLEVHRTHVVVLWSFGVVR